jgi:predicted nuclease of predicted toxin-antitoxin system
MARLYADEGFPRQASRLLKDLGHDVLTVQEAGQDNQPIPDDQVLAFATSQDRVLLTVNRVDFIRLHKQNSNHAGIIVCTEDLNRQRLAEQIHAAILAESNLAGRLIRVNRPNSP